MKEIFSISGIDIFQRDFNQIMIRGNEHEQLNQIINKGVSLNLPNENLKIVNNDNILIAKHSFDQWNLIYFNDQNYRDVLKLVSNLNSNNQVCASDYSYGQVYFEISGEKSSKLVKTISLASCHDHLSVGLLGKGAFLSHLFIAVFLNQEDLI